MDAVYAEQVSGLPPVLGIARRSEVVKGLDGNEIRLFIQATIRDLHGFAASL